MQRFILSALAVMFTGSVASADLLFSTPIGLGGSQQGQTDYITIRIAAAIPELGFYGLPIFAGNHWTPADVGQTITTTAANDAQNFFMFTEALTDDRPEDFWFSFYPAPAINESGYLLPEPLVIWGDTNDPRIDVHGHSVVAYTLTLNSLSITNTPDGRSSFQASATFSAYDRFPIPEPGLVSVSSLAALLCRRRRKGTEVRGH